MNNKTIKKKEPRELKALLRRSRMGLWWTVVPGLLLPW
jgi:hypothetical protein